MTSQPLSLRRAQRRRGIRHGIVGLGSWLALAVAIALAVPAAAGGVLAPAPTGVTFGDLPARTTLGFTSQSGTFTDGDKCADVNPDPRAHSGPNVLGGPFPAGFTCNPMRATFGVGQSYVSLFAAHTPDVVEGPAQGRATLVAYRDCPPFASPTGPIDSDVVDESSSTLSPLSVSDPGGGIICVELDVRTGWYVVDDLSLSRDPQPDTEITAGPAGSTLDASATFAFRANQAAGFQCALDAGQFEACASPRRLDGLGAGSHTFQVRAVDIYGAVDPSPAGLTWTVTAGPPDTDRDGGPEGTDTCPDAPNPDQSDRDRDRVGDACEMLPAGDIPAVAGKSVVAGLISGEVFVKLPGASPRQASGEGGFVPLKGVASVPVGATVDARRGQVAVTSAAEFGGSGTSQASLSASIFQIKQQRARKRAKQRRRRATTDFVLVTPVGAARSCAARQPPKGVVRTLLGSTSKGLYRTFGGASVATVRKGRWRISDRCNGTLTEVGSGRAVVFNRVTGHQVTVRAGRAYFVRSRLFTAQKGRLRPPPRP